MKFSAPLTLACLATGVVAELSVVKRNFAEVADVLSKVHLALNSLSDSVKDFNGDFEGVISKSEGLVATMDAGAAAIRGSSNLDLKEALQLLPAVDGVRDSGSTLAKQLENRRPAVQAKGLCDQARGQIDKIISATKNLIPVIVSKVPAAAQDIAKTKVSELLQVLQQAKDNFAPGKR